MKLGLDFLNKILWQAAFVCYSILADFINLLFMALRSRSWTGE